MLVCNVRTAYIGITNIFFCIPCILSNTKLVLHYSDGFDGSTLDTMYGWLGAALFFFKIRSSFYQPCNTLPTVINKDIRLRQTINVVEIYVNCHLLYSATSCQLTNASSLTSVGASTTVTMLFKAPSIDKQSDVHPGHQFKPDCRPGHRSQIHRGLALVILARFVLV
jgi:hypothetical protein